MGDSDKGIRKNGLVSSPAGIVLVGFLVVAGFYLVTEHRAHLYGALPWLLLLACPLIHLFMHHGHGDRGGADDQGTSRHHHYPREA